jgi:hypothetical protein
MDTKQITRNERVLNLYLGPGLRDWLQREAQRQDRPMCRIVRQALERYRKQLEITRTDAACEEELKGVIE